MRIIGLALLTVLFFLVLGLIIAIGRPETGPIEKVVLGFAMAGLFVVAGFVGRLGRPEASG